MAQSIDVMVASEAHHKFADIICDQYAESAKARGTGIARRSPEYVKKKMTEQRSVIALDKANDSVAGFCYIESWGHQKFAANSGLIVFPDYRNLGLATRIKEQAFKLSRKEFPQAKLFGLTTSLPVMKINSELGYIPVTFSELTTDDQFWKGCQSCVNYPILESKERKNCLCTAMLYDPTEVKRRKRRNSFQGKVLERLKRIKQASFLKDAKVFSWLG